MKFKVGDLIRGKTSVVYALANKKMTKGEVVEIGVGCMEVKILEHEDESMIGCKLVCPNVEATDFELIAPTKWAEVAKLFSLELGEEFDIEGKEVNPYRFTEKGLYHRHGKVGGTVLKDIISDTSLIIKKPFKPRGGQEYWFITPSGQNDSYNWRGTTLDCLNFKLGNCFRTIYEAEENKDRIMNEIYEVEE